MRGRGSGMEYTEYNSVLCVYLLKEGKGNTNLVSLSNVRITGLFLLTTLPIRNPRPAPTQSSFVPFPSVINLWQRPETGVDFLAARSDKQSVLGKSR